MINKWKKLAQQVGKEVDDHFSDKIYDLTHINGHLMGLIEKSGINHDELQNMIEIIRDFMLWLILKVDT